MGGLRPVGRRVSVVTGASSSRLVLAGIFVGGSGVRMGGCAKGLLTAPGGGTLVDRWRALLQAVGVERVILVGHHDAYASVDLEAIDEVPAGIGPIGGLAALLERGGARPGARAGVRHAPRVRRARGALARMGRRARGGAQARGALGAPLREIRLHPPASSRAPANRRGSARVAAPAAGGGRPRVSPRNLARRKNSATGTRQRTRAAADGRRSYAGSFVPRPSAWSCAWPSTSHRASCHPTQYAPSGPCSRFQIGARALTRSISARHAA
jgi:hypothetical protein